MTAGPARPALDVLVIGGGQAGLAMGYHLTQRGLRFQIVESGPALGSAWRSRWDSLRLFTPGRYDNLPGLAFPAAPDAYPGKDDVADYLQVYAAQFGLPVKQGILILQVAPGSPAARAGLQVQDIVTRINDTAIARGVDLRRVLRDLRPGTPVTLSVLRPSGATTVRATLAEAPDAR